MFKFKFPDMMELKFSLFKTKQDYNLTNKEIAKALNISEMTVSNWFSGRTNKINEQYKEAIEDYLNKIWRPALICIWNENETRKGYFFLVGNIHDPFYTWIHYGLNNDEINFLNLKESQVAAGEATIYIVKEYTSLDEASRIGRKEEWQYNLGAMEGDNNALAMGPGGAMKIIEGIKYEPPRA